MRSILTLLSGDFDELRRWFQKETVSKLFVAIGFLLLIALVTTALYGGTTIFFRGLSRYEEFGFSSANYLLHAGLIILFVLITVLSTVSFCTFLYASKRKMSTLLVLPLSAHTIPGWLFIREMMVSFLFFLFFLTPFMVSFYRYFVEADIISYSLTYIVVLIVLSMITPLLGIGLGLLLCLSFQKSKQWTLVGLVSITCVVGYMLLQLIFPSQLKQLYAASPAQFDSIYGSLPLTNQYVPTWWLIKGITEGNIFYVLPFLSATVLVFICIESLAAKNFSKVYLSLFDKPFRKVSYQKFDTNFLTTKWPLLYKDLLSVTRIPQELGYGVFLSILTFVFFIFLLFARQFRSETYEGGNILLVFYFVTFFFYTIAYALRMIFPLMAKEGRATWHIFSLPLKSEKIVEAKLLVSLLLIFPYILGSFVLWMVVQSSNGLILGIFASVAIVTVVLGIVSLGIIHPNFSESENAEKISTSGMGLLALFCSLIITGVCSFSLYLYVTNQQALWMMFLPVLFLLCAMGILYRFAQKAAKEYQF